MKFKYEGFLAGGQVKHGEIEATTKEMAVESLRNNYKIYISNIQPYEDGMRDLYPRAKSEPATPPPGNGVAAPAQPATPPSVIHENPTVSHEAPRASASFLARGGKGGPGGPGGPEPLETRVVEAWRSLLSARLDRIEEIVVELKARGIDDQKIQQTLVVGACMDAMKAQ